MFYSKSTGGFYSAEIHGASIPADAVEITDALHASLLAGQSAGKIISPGLNGAPTLTDPPPSDPKIVIDAKLAAVRVVREGILNRLAGIVLAANLTGDTATTAAYVTVRQGLLDITKDLPEDIDADIKARYSGLVAQCTPQMRSAFAQVDA